MKECGDENAKDDAAAVDLQDGRDRGHQEGIDIKTLAV